MKKIRKYNWPELLNAFDKSGLTQTVFCEQNNINPKYFSQKRLDLKGARKSSFDKVDVQPHSSSTLVIHVGRCHVHCPDSMSFESFTALVHQLA